MNIMNKYNELFSFKGNYFKGNYHLSGDSSETGFNRHCPYDTNTKLYTIREDLNHIPQIIESAVEGFQSWKRTSLEERIQCLKKYQEALINNKETIAHLISIETGKPYWEALSEAGALPSKVDVSINHGLQRVKNKTIENITSNTNAHVHHRPIGPCLVIGPFNFPCHLANGQIVNALLTGNSIIFKPSEKTLKSASVMFDCLRQANFPEGVINFIEGTGESAKRIIDSGKMRGVFFTGSLEVGKKILAQTSSQLQTMVALELGGKNTTIVWEDGWTPTTLTELVKSCYLTTGQRCTSTGIVAIHQSLLPQAIESFHKVAKKLIVDSPFKDEPPFMGPLIDESAAKMYLNYMGMAVREEIEEIMRGKMLERKTPGHFVSPSIHLLEKPKFNERFLRSEIFGPSVIFIPYEEPEEAVKIANFSPYGLAASVFSKDEKIFDCISSEIEAGIVNWNRSTVGAHSRLPFGGVKQSGNFRPAGISMIDHCVFEQAQLRVPLKDDDKTDQLGIKKE